MSGFYLFFTIYVIIILFMAFNISELFCLKKVNNNLLFYALTNYILNFSVIIFFYYYRSMPYSVFTCLLLFISSIPLLKEIKKIRGNFSYITILYSLLIFYVLNYFILF